jgi:hypothetical protein
VINSGNAPNAIARNLLRSLLYRNTYGAFAEIAAYEWLSRCNMTFTPQVELTANDVLSESGSTLDGKMWTGLYFDAKAFGFTGRLIDKLKERLQKDFPNDEVAIADSWDVPLIALSELLADSTTVIAELQRNRFYRKWTLSIYVKPRQRVIVSHRSVEPYRLAKENAHFPFLDAKQFTRNYPFALIFITHPWFNSGIISNDFANVDTQFTRSLARRAFMQFSTDSTLLRVISKGVAENTTLSDASKLLSAVFFINVWPPDADPAITQKPPSWVYLNPRATHRVNPTSMAFFRADNVHGFRIDDFAHDNY